MLFKKSFFLVTFTISCSLSATAIVGGGHNQTPAPDFEPYVAIVNANAELIPITGAVPTGKGIIIDVDINANNYAIAGGQHMSWASPTPYLVLIDPNAVATAVTGNIATAPGRIEGVSINNARLAVATGQGNTPILDTPYAAFINPSGVATSINLGIAGSPTGIIEATAINDSHALISGEAGVAQNYAYAAVVDLASPANAILIAGLDGATNDGRIKYVALNGVGQGMVVGRFGPGGDIYAATVDVTSPTPTPTSLLGASPGAGLLTGVDINDSGQAIIVGQESGNVYAALVNANTSSVTILPSVSGAGELLATAINSSGAGLIGGFSGSNQYAALVDYNTQQVTPLAFSNQGGISRVDINDAGVGLITGFEGTFFGTPSTPILYLVAPDGTLVPITDGALANGDGLHWNVSMNNQTINLNDVVPSNGSPASAVFGQVVFELSTQVLSTHLTYHNAMHHALRSRSYVDEDEVGLLVDASKTIRTKPINSSSEPTQQTYNHSIWAIPFGSYAHQKKLQLDASADIWIGGAMLGYDYLGLDNIILGLGAAYAYNNIHLSEGRGHADVHNEFIVFYGTFDVDNFFVSAGLWGGLYQIHNTRNSILSISAKSNIDGYLLTPHLEMSYLFDPRRNYSFEPFVMFDWANNWQNKFKESGGSGFNIQMGNQYTSLLRSELGMRFYQIVDFDNMEVIFQEKGSYINKKPFDAGATTATFLGSISPFTVNVFSDKMQNLGAAQINVFFNPKNGKYPFGAINYQAEFGSSFQSHLFFVQIGKYF